MVKLLRKLSGAAAFAVAAAGTPLHAGPYLPVTEARDSLAFLDLGTVKAVDRERWVWFITVARRTPSGLPDGADVIALNIRFDCARGQMQFMGANRFRPDRTPIQLDATPSEAAPVPPDTAFSRMMDAVCDGTYERGSVLETPKGFTMFDLSTVIKRAEAR